MLSAAVAVMVVEDAVAAEASEEAAGEGASAAVAAVVEMFFEGEALRGATWEACPRSAAPALRP